MLPAVIVGLVRRDLFVPPFCPWPCCPELSRPIARGLVAGSAHRQIARRLGCHHGTVTRRSRRLGRHARLLHHLALGELSLSEPVLVVDDDPAIRRAAASLPAVTPSACPTPVRGPKGTPRSAAARARDAALFPNDRWHRFLRHSQAAHRRQTIAFGRIDNGLVERLAPFLVWRNLVQARSERHPKNGSTAMPLGLTDRVWIWARGLAERRFPGRVQPREELLRFYRRELVTPHLPVERRHVLGRTF
jgi:hypothetical protein